MWQSIPIKSYLVQSLTSFTLLMHHNKYAVKMLKQIFKKFLFKKVNTNITEEQNWGQTEWFNFFQLAK